MKKFLIGTGVALVTPFNTDHSVDYNGLTKLINFCLDGGVEYLVAMGTTGEVATLSHTERESVVDHIVKITDQRVPIVIGIGGNNTQQIVEEVRSVDTSRFAAILSVVPYYNKPSQEGLYQHYKTIAENAPLPVILYNVPGRTGINMTAATTLRLADLSNICAVKEATGDITQVLKILAGKPDDFIVLSGDDMLALPLVTAGGHGVITVVGQGFPKAFSDMIRLGLEGNNKEAYALHNSLIEPTEYAFEEGNPAGIKGILKAKEICGDEVRLPLQKASVELTKKISNHIAQ